MRARWYWGLVLAVSSLLPAHAADYPTVKKMPQFPIKQGERILWFGSSSTSIGTWPRTMEFLLRTRHPELKLSFEKQGIGGATLASELADMDSYFSGLKPDIVFFNFGGNDSTKGDKGIPVFQANITKAVDKATAHGSKTVLITPQPGDERLAGKRNDNLAPYTDVLMKTANELGVDFADVHHPLDQMLQKGMKDEPNYTINKDKIHLTDSAYVAWGFFLYEALNAPAAVCSLDLSHDGRVTGSKRCKASEVRATKAGVITFTREDEILPVLPPNPLPSNPIKAVANPLAAPEPSAALEYAIKHFADLPPRKYCPLEPLSLYMLKITGLPQGSYAISVDEKPVGTATAAQLASGVNINTLILDSGNPAPWHDLVTEIWKGKSLESIGATKFKYKIEPVAK